MKKSIKPKVKKDRGKDLSSQIITKEMTIGETLYRYPETAPIMVKYGLHCIGCNIAAMETLEQGALLHRIDIKKFIDDLNKAIKKHPKSK